MPQNYTGQTTCSVCNERFNSDREREEHEQTAHPRQDQNDSTPNSRQNHPPDQIDPNTQEEEKIA